MINGFQEKNCFISQIFLSTNDQSIPEKIKSCADTIEKFATNCNYKIFSNELLREFIKVNFDTSVLGAFDSLVPFAYKSDLGRYCILYILGGWYFDIGVKLHQGIQLPTNTNALFFRDIQRNSLTAWSIASAVMYTKPGNPIFLEAIKEVMQNCKDRYYGITPLCPTGPVVIGRAIASHKQDKNIYFGDFIELTPEYTVKNNAFVTPDGMIFAFGKQAVGGSLLELGHANGNNYIQLWNRKEVYR